MVQELEFDFSAPAPEPERDIYTPGRLNREARTLLERGLPTLWLEGEISNLSRPSSGHWYFSLKDASAQLRCAMFRQRNLLARFTPKDGIHVLARGRVSLYEARGDYQFIADHMEEAGEGALRRRFELLKAKLAAEGLFETAHKRALPRLPRRIGVITSPTGAAIRDVLHILRRRFCTIPVLIYPVQVQGAAAAAQVARTIRLASARAECDVLILARGGGSLEDLWAFNEENVARAIYDCVIPLVTGIGHEVDFTIADFVADLRAPTPSGAAELVAPDCNEWSRTTLQLFRRLRTVLDRTVTARQERFAWLQRRLAQLHPAVELRQRAQRLDELEQRLLRAARTGLASHSDRFAWLRHRLVQHHPAVELRQHAQQLEALEQRLQRVARAGLASRRDRFAWLQHRLMQLHPGIELRQHAHRLDGLEHRLTRVMRAGVTERVSHVRHLSAQLRQHSPALLVSAARGRLELGQQRLRSSMRQHLAVLNNQLRLEVGKLNTISPLATLQRGYAIVSDAKGKVITNAAGTRVGDAIHARLARGSVEARVERIIPPEKEP